MLGFVKNLIFCSLLLCCNKGYNYSGYVINQEELKMLQPGKQDKLEVFKKVGKPAFVSFYEPNIWLYAYRIVSRGWFFDRVVEKKLCFITFDEQGKFKNYQLRDTIESIKYTIDPERSQVKGVSPSVGSLIASSVITPEDQQVST